MQRAIREYEGQHMGNVSEGDLLEEDLIGDPSGIRTHVPADYTADTEATALVYFY